MDTNYDIRLPYFKEENRYTLSEMAGAESWGVGHLEADKVHDRTTGNGVVLFVIDTEDTATHPDVEPATVKRYCKRFTNEPSSLGFEAENIKSKGGHGLHVGHTALQVAPGLVLGFLKALTNNGFGSSAWVAAAIRHAADVELLPEHAEHARIINLSLGSDTPSNAIMNALQHAKEKGVYVFAAAGNDGNEGDDSVDYPGAWDDLAVTISAVNKNNERPEWSSYGRPVNLTCPGVAIRAAYKDGYADLSGTSMATPHAAGVCALLLEHLRNVQPNARLTPAAMEDALEYSATDVGPKGEDDYFGAGLPIVPNYITSPPDPEPEPEPSPPPQPFVTTWWPLGIWAGVGAGLAFLGVHWAFWVAWGVVLAGLTVLKLLGNWRIDF